MKVERKQRKQHCRTCKILIEEYTKESRTNWKKAIRDPLYKRALASENRVFDAELDGYKNLGAMDVKCEKGCGAVHFPNERTRFHCCSETGNGSFELLQDLDPFWKELLEDPDFRKSIRNYNCAFQIAILESSWDSHAKKKKDRKRDGFVVHSKFPYHIRVHGQLFHVCPPALAKPGEPAKFVQLYIVDNALEEIMKHKENANLDQEKVERILEYLKENNPWAQAISRTVKQHMLNNPNVKNVVIDFVPNTGHQYRVPREDNIAGFVPTNATGKIDSHRSIFISNADDSFSKINELNAMYDPLHYVMMFPKGDPGFSKIVSDQQDKDKDTLLDFYQQRLQIRPNRHVSLCHFGRLSHEYVIDMWLKIESYRLAWIKNNQKDLRVSSEPDDRPDDAPVGNDEGRSIVYLPPSFTGGKRYYRRKFLDGVNVANQVGAGTVLVTMTANPNWPEIRDALEPGETANDRPDIVARVFYMKWNQLKEDITKHHVLGFCYGIEDVHEFQKQGMPHGHLIAILAKQDQPRTPEDVDRIVCAELPDRVSDPEGFDLVTRNMLHGPCAEGKCLDKNGVCSKQYPFAFQDTTTWQGELRLQYRRRNDGRTFTGRGGHIFDNRYVVPYNMYLLKKYRCHLNVLVCSTKIASVRYMFGYINKGVDMATIRATLKSEDDEIEFYTNGRYISAPEACHKLLGFETLNISPCTMRLPVHLPGKKFRIRGQVGRARNTSDNRSELEAFFELNSKRMAQGETDKLYYTNVSKYYTWNTTSRRWARRINLDKCITGCVLNRMDNVLVKEGERYYLRLLLSQRPNPTCFNDLLRVDGVQYGTFQDACRAMGLLADDKTWHDTLKETESFYSPRVVRSVFAQILAYSIVNDPLQLWTNHLVHLAEDFRKKDGSETVQPRHTEKAVQDIETNLNGMLTSLANIGPLAFLLPKKCANDRRGKHVIKKRKYTSDEQTEYRDKFRKTYEESNAEQTQILDAALHALGNIPTKQGKPQKLFIVYAAAGTGKTFTNEGLICYTRYLEGTNTACVAVSTTAISAQLLSDGHTAHSTFKLPILIDDDNVVTCGIDFDSEIAAILKEAKMLIWDEAMSARKELIEAVDRFFRELFGIDEPFGGLVVILSGDLRQTLPKIPRAKRGAIVAACITNSKLMKDFEVISLTKNMRIYNCEHPDLEDLEDLVRFEKFLLDLGNGDLPTDEEERFVIPSFIHQSKSMEGLIKFVYGEDIEQLSDSDLSERAIMCPLNEDVREVNDIILRKLTGNTHTYFSTDTELDPYGEPIEELPPEVLHSMNRSGLPAHKLEIKEGCLVMCLRNMTVGNICNGTKMKVLNARQHVIECLVLTGRAKGTIVVLPRITLEDNSRVDAVRFRRKQFPIRLAYACSIDKSQGQSLAKAGLLCRTECFAHGQCYTGWSRPKGPEWFTIFQPDPHSIQPGETRMMNVVWPEVFSNIN